MLYQLSYCPLSIAIAANGQPIAGAVGQAITRNPEIPRQTGPIRAGPAAGGCNPLRPGPAYRVSLCKVCWRSHRQNFFISIRSRSFSLFLVVM